MRYLLLFVATAALHAAAIDSRLFSGLEYRSIANYLQGQMTKEEMIEELAAKTRQFAKRQRLWLKHDPTIQWLPFPVDTENAIKLAVQFLDPTLTNAVISPTITPLVAKTTFHRMGL